MEDVSDISRPRDEQTQMSDSIVSSMSCAYILTTVQEQVMDGFAGNRVKMFWMFSQYFIYNQRSYDTKCTISIHFDPIWIKQDI